MEHLMPGHLSPELLAFRLKLGQQNMKKHVFVSAGQIADKKRILPSIKKLAALNALIYATSGTSVFLAQQGVATTMVRKITEEGGVDARSMLLEGAFDLVVNILTGDGAYDEKSDAKIIRTLAIEHGIPLITDADIAIASIDRLVRQIEHQRTTPTPRGGWNMRDYFARLVDQRGGYKNYHAHADKAYLMTPEDLELGEIDMQAKWDLFKTLKQGAAYSDEGLYARIERATQTQIGFGVTHFRTHVDADTSIGLKAIKAALAVRAAYLGRIKMEIGIQPLEGVLDPAARWYVEEACGMADIVGSLPSKDRHHTNGPERHLDFMLSIAKEHGNRLDAHVDQENNPLENETELLARRTIKLGMEGRVMALHSISPNAKPKYRRGEIYKMLKDAGISVCICPRAALSMKPVATKRKVPIHNSIAPVLEMREAGIKVVLGTDNISDFFMPFVDGDMWTEVQVLMEACRWYDAPAIADIACDSSLFG